MEQRRAKGVEMADFYPFELSMDLFYPPGFSFKNPSDKYDIESLPREFAMALSPLINRLYAGVGATIDILSITRFMMVLCDSLPTVVHTRDLKPNADS